MDTTQTMMEKIADDTLFTLSEINTKIPSADFRHHLKKQKMP
ncbi:16775_t:CDS:2, partial [Funneliformis caledonium]